MVVKSTSVRTGLSTQLHLNAIVSCLLWIWFPAATSLPQNTKLNEEFQLCPPGCPTRSQWQFQIISHARSPDTTWMVTTQLAAFLELRFAQRKTKQFMSTNPFSIIQRRPLVNWQKITTNLKQPRRRP